MQVCLLISDGVPHALDLALRWARDGHEVTAVLLDAAAASARSGHRHGDRLDQVLAAGVVVQVDDSALRRRAIGPRTLAEGVKPTDLDQVAELVGDVADRVVWL